MFGQPLRPHALPPCGLLIAALGISLCLAAPLAAAQDRSTQERLDRLERDLNMLQRQVYRGGPPPPMSAGDGAGAVSVTIRMDRLEDQMRELTGRVEEVVTQVAQLRQRLDQAGPDSGGRIASAEPPAPRIGPPAAARSARQFPAPPPDSVEDEPAPLHLAPSGGQLGPPGAYPPPAVLGDGPTPIFGTLTPPGEPRVRTPGSYPPSSEQLASAAPSSAAAAGSSPAAQYNHAFGLLKQADYPGAEAELKAFVEQHPKDAMAGNAQYWLGESYYARGKYIEAASAFAEGYKRYPKSAKAADGLLKLGMSLARANQKQNACVALGQLDQAFPSPGAAIKTHADAEKKRLGC